MCPQLSPCRQHLLPMEHLQVPAPLGVSSLGWVSPFPIRGLSLSSTTIYGKVPGPLHPHPTLGRARRTWEMVVPIWAHVVLPDLPNASKTQRKEDDRAE